MIQSMTSQAGAPAVRILDRRQCAGVPATPRWSASSCDLAIGGSSLDSTTTTPQWTPPEAAQTPIIVMQFDEVTSSEWTFDSQTDDETPAEVNGQVEDFAHFNNNTFRLTTHQYEIQFTAGKLTVRLLPRQA
jgi:hypothetical protein